MSRIRVIHRPRDTPPSPKTAKRLAEAVKREREKCAIVCEIVAMSYEIGTPESCALYRAAARIRARADEEDTG